MSYFPHRDFLIEVAKGNVGGHSLVHKFGRNDAVPNGSWAWVNLLGFTNWPLSAATTVRIKAGGHTSDTSGGAGAREVTVQGIDSNLVELSEAIATNGASASTATTAQFWRVHRAWVSSYGTYNGANFGNIDIENSAGGTDLIRIATAEGQTQYAAFSIPTATTGYLLSVHAHVDAGKTADLRVMTRADLNDTTAPVASRRLKLYFDGVLGPLVYKPCAPEFSLPALSDIWVEANGDGAGTEVSADFELLLVAD